MRACHYLGGNTHLPVLKVILKKGRIRKWSIKFFFFFPQVIVFICAGILLAVYLEGWNLLCCLSSAKSNPLLHVALCLKLELVEWQVSLFSYKESVPSLLLRYIKFWFCYARYSTSSCSPVAVFWPAALIYSDAACFQVICIVAIFTDCEGELTSSSILVRIPAFVKALCLLCLLVQYLY